MIKQIIRDEEIAQLKVLLDRFNKIAITCHVSPDGDAVGSSLGLCHLLRALGKTVNVVTPDQTPASLRFLPGIKEIIAYSKNTELGEKILSEAELIFCLDFNTPSRVDKMQEVLVSSSAAKVLLDHHLDPAPFCDLTISYSQSSSTCELLFRVITRLELLDKVTYECATCIYTGLMTDTGNFSFNSNNPDLYLMIAELLKKGIDKDKIYTLAMNTSSEDRIRLLGYATYEKMQIFPEYNAALITLTKSDLEQFDYKKGDTESLVNMPLAIPNVHWSIFMREEDDYIKVSARSQGNFAVNILCERYFNGGGHKNASGGEFRGTMDEAIDVFYTILQNLK